ncbi:MAG: tyrosine-type recombinase/integrase [Kiritimatiellae bacterium]|nr:tyrosine-type recombinase/integrase [Kiritimatiellia bacterium]
MARGKGKGTLQQEKNGIWTIRATINGVRKSKSTGTTDRKEAERILDEFMAPYVRGDDIRSYQNFQAAVATVEQRAEIEEDAKPQLKLSEAFEAYSVSPLRRDLSQATLEGKKVTWQHFINWLKLPYPEAIEVRHVNAKMVEAYMRDLRDGRAASTYNNRLCVLREMFRVLMRVARAKSNPFDDIKLLTDDSHTRRELTIEELQRLVTCANRVGGEWRKLFAVGIYTGLRLGDCCRLEWKTVDVPRSIIQLIPSKTRKYAHGKPITIPIHPVLSQVLQETPIVERTGYVFPTIAGYYNYSRPKVSYQIQKIFNAAGIVTSVTVEGRKAKAPEATFHSLRHTFVSLSANAGVPLHIVQSIVGHESTSMTRHYYHENERALRQAVAAIPCIGETEMVNDSPLPFCPPEPTAVIPDSMRSFDAENNRFLETPKEVVEIPCETVEVKEEPVEQLPAPVEVKRTIDTDIGREPCLPGDPTVHPRVGGIKARPRPPKTEWLGEAVKRWARRKGTGALDATMQLVGNGGYKFLQEIWNQGANLPMGEVIDMLEAYLVAKD